MSYQVVIIDDNINTVSSLRLGIDWQTLGFSMAGTAGDGIRGQALIKEKRPDVVITDIMMPGQDGLAMVEQLREQLQDARVIVITGYDKFQYATQAIRLSVFDYILKPVDDDELKATLLRAKESLDRDRAFMAEKQRMETFQQRVQLLGYLTTPGEAAQPVNWQKAGGIQGYFFVVASVPSGVSQPLLQRVEYQHFPDVLTVTSLIIEEELVLLCGVRFGAAADWKRYAAEVLRILHGHMPDMLCAVSAYRKEEAGGLRGAYLEARRLLMGLSVMGNGATEAFFGDAVELTQPSYLPQHEALCTHLVEKSSEFSPEETWEKLLKAANGRVRYLRVLLMFYCTKTLQKRLAEGQWAGEAGIDAAAMDIMRITSTEQARQWLLRFCIELACSGEGCCCSILMRNVLQYVNTYAADGIRLEDVAKEFHVSPNYLSTLVRKETGKTYQQHVIEAKMRISKQLLDDTRMRVEEIAYAVGYENYISFYNMFRRMEGQTPSAYRMRNRETP